jgi:GTP-binding protein LepA
MMPTTLDRTRKICPFLTALVRAQVANYFLAWEANLKIIPVMNKIDLPTSGTLHVLHLQPECFTRARTRARTYAYIQDPARVLKELANMGFDESEVLKASGKTGEGVEGILSAVIERLPAYDASLHT